MADLKRILPDNCLLTHTRTCLLFCSILLFWFRILCCSLLYLLYLGLLYRLILGNFLQWLIRSCFLERSILAGIVLHCILRLCNILPGRLLVLLPLCIGYSRCSIPCYCIRLLHLR